MITMARYAFVLIEKFWLFYGIFTYPNSASVAKQLQDDSFAFIFGINTLVALIFQTILTVVLVSEQGFELDQRTHYRVLSGYFVVLGGIYAVTSIAKFLYEKIKIR